MVEERKSHRVLVVDDDEDNVRILEAVLRKNGFESICTRSGHEALEKLPESGVDLVLLDIMMPDMDGIEVLSKIRAMGGMENLPVILLTGKSQDEDVISGYQYGADYYITKPFSPKQLLYGIHLVLGEKTAD